ncbi:MAG: 50S ribosomal protein L22 [Bacteroidales bacterium]|nr:50S ribosomal protein L22 [Bacteroidales bacterium]
MGKRKRLMAERLKEAKKSVAIAKLREIPTSPRKMRLVADNVRGVEVNHALDILHYTKKAAAVPMEKLLRSAIANWEAKNQDKSGELDKGNVFIKTVMVDGGRMIKRLRPMPQGRAGRIRKRSNHVTIILDVKAPVESKAVEPATEEA